MQEHRPGTDIDIAVDESSDLITSRIETAVNLTSHTDSLSNIKLSSDILQFLEAQGEHPEDVLSKPIFKVTETNDSLPLTHYFISSSHNTYLLGFQLFGSVSAEAYTHVLSHHCRCVEIDVWPPAEPSGKPIVTHGHTFSQHILFSDVCIAIGNAVHPDSWPVMVSLECHLDIPDQDEIVKIMKETWGEKLVQQAVEGVDSKNITPGELRGRIVLMVEYYPPAQSTQEAETETIEPEPEDQETSGQKPPRIGPSLAALGVYAHSVKPQKDWLTKIHSQPTDLLEPSHILYNLSENTVKKLLPKDLLSLISNSLVYMRRVYPNFLRVTSSNIEPLIHWGSGTQVAALNWQRYDRGVEINEAMFVGSGGWVLKPNNLLGTKAPNNASRIRLTCEVAYGCNIPLDGHEGAYLKAALFLVSGEQKINSKAVPSSSGDASSGDFTWKELIEWQFTEGDELAFVRISVYCSKFGKDERMGTFCARVKYLQPGWRLIRLFNKKGKHNGGMLLVRFHKELVL
ncbi:PLC-like phosphodiesterase [Ramaria rubella]|nr:PLC-like phosphodiesterase [Ramaria rubella]